MNEQVCRIERLRKKTVYIKGEVTRVGTSHDMFSQFAKRPTHFLFCRKKRRNILHVYILSAIFKHTQSAFRFNGIIANNRKEKKSFPVCANLVYLHRVWVVGSRQAATVISLWFTELDCDCIVKLTCQNEIKMFTGFFDSHSESP